MDVITLTSEDGVTMSCFQDGIPAWVAAELDKRYESLHASLPFLTIYRSLDKAGCYVAKRDERTLEILVFLRKRQRIEVLNEMFDLSDTETKRFVQFMFHCFPEAAFVCFKAVRAEVGGMKYPAQQYPSKHTFVISLPATPEEYLARIGKTTRASIRQQMNTVKRTFPSFTSKCLLKDEIDASTLRAIVERSEQRINGKGVRFRHDIERIAALSRECGFVVVLLIDGEMCAGSINYQVGSNFFGEVTCYDPAYHRYGLGKLCTYMTVCESILRGGRHFYLGGGEFDFKERMLGKRIDMDQLHIYRSYARAAINFKWMAVAFAQGQLRRYRTAMLARKDSLASMIAFKLVRAYRNRMAK